MTIWLILPGVVYRFRKSIDRIVKSARFLWVGVCLLFLALLSPSDAVSDVWLLQIVNNIEDLLFAGVVLCTIANRKLIVQRSLTLAQTRPVKTLSTLTIIAAITLFLTELTVRVYTHYRPKPEQFFLEYMDLYEVVDPEVGHAMKTECRGHPFGKHRVFTLYGCILAAPRPAVIRLSKPALLRLR